MSAKLYRQRVLQKFHQREPNEKENVIKEVAIWADQWSLSSRLYARMMGEADSSVINAA
jgi:hypothetical protein